MRIRISNWNWLINKRPWRFVGFISSVMGLVCYALSSSFKHLFGEWNFLKVTVYIGVSFSISSMMLFLKKWKLSRRFMLKTHVAVLALLLTSLYSFVSDKAVNGKSDILSLFSCAAFALMSLCLSRQINLGFEADLLNFFLGCLTVQLMQINLMLSIIAAIFCYSLMFLRSKLDNQREIETPSMEDHVTVDIDDGGERGYDENYTSDFKQIQRLRRRESDGYNWRKYEEKIVKRCGNQISYYKCNTSNCPVKKKVERTIDGEIVGIIYKGNHLHIKPKHSLKRNSSSEHFYSLLPSETTHLQEQEQSFASHGNGQSDSDATPESSSISI